MGFFKDLFSLAVVVTAAYFTGGATLAYQTAAVFATSMVVSRVFGQKPPKPQDNGVRQQVPPTPVNSLPVVYGEAYLGGTFVDAVLSTNQKVMWYVLSISSISPNGLFTFDKTKMYFGDRLISFDSGEPAKVVSLTDGSGNVDTKISGNLYIYLYRSNASGTITNLDTNGTSPGSGAPNTIMSTANGVPSGLEWTSTNRQMNGQAFAIVKLIYNTDAGTTQLQPVTFHCSHTLNGTGVAKPGDVWVDYLESTIYGGAVSSSLVDTTSATSLNAYSDELITFTDNTGTLSTQPRYRINGVIDTGTNVLENIDKLLECCDSWMTYNSTSGQWSIVVNKAQDASMSFNDDNIIGDIRTSTLDINQSINQIEAKFPNKLNKDVPGYVYITTPSSLLYPNEPVNKYTTEYALTNDSVQAQYLANRVLEQAREDLIITITTTYYGIQANAGDVVSVTNATYGWSAKLFRVLKVEEASLPDGSLGATLDLSEYNAQVYDDKDITQYQPAPNSDLASSDYFSSLSAPTISDQQQNAPVPSFSVNCVMPITGRVTSVTLYYTTVAVPSSSDWLVLSIQDSSDSQPFTNGSTVKFTHVSLPTNTYYFAFKVGNETSQSRLSSISTGFYWLPNPTSSAVAGTFVATFSPPNYQIPYIGGPSFSNVNPQLYGTTAGGSVDFTTAQTDAAMSNDTWRIGGSPYTGNSDIVKYAITIGNPTDGGNYAQFPQPTGMSTDNATLSVPVRYKDSLGNVVQGATAVLPFTFAFQGQSARICYSKTSLSSLSPTPTSITTSGNSSYPPNNSWGTGTVWQATAPTITAGESVYQSDGIYNPVLDQTVWNVPYLSNLKVGQLSAISAIMGTLTAGTINTGSGSALLAMGSDSNGSVWRLTRLAATLLPPAYIIDNAPSGAPDSLWLNSTRPVQSYNPALEYDGNGIFVAPNGNQAANFSDPNTVSKTALFAIQGQRYEGQMVVSAYGMGHGQHGIRIRHYTNVPSSGGVLNASAICATEGGAAFYAETGGYGPFTGVHDGIILNYVTPEIGDILVDVQLIAKNGVSDTLYEVGLSTQSMSVAIGIFASSIPLSSKVPAALIDKENTIAYDPVYDPITGELVSESYKNPPKPEYELIKDEYNLANVNAVGEGQVNVCGENGNIQAGDLIVTSSTLGKGMKQSDDIIRNYTVAKARESVTFSSPDEVKMIACVYLCG